MWNEKYFNPKPKPVQTSLPQAQINNLQPQMPNLMQKPKLKGFGDYMAENVADMAYGAAVLLLLYTLGETHYERDEKTEDIFNLVDWTTIFFFCGLFMVVHALEITGVLQILGEFFIDLTEGSIKKTVSNRRLGLFKPYALI